MITAEQLETMSRFTAPALGRALAVNGYAVKEFKTVKFLGLTNAGQFCYRADYAEEDSRGQTWCKVFLTLDPEKGTVVADY